MQRIKSRLKQLKNFWPILLLVVLMVPLLFPLFHKGMFISDDAEWMIIRFSAFHQAFRDGQFPVRWLGRLNHEYGYPVANFLYPGFMYLAEIPKVLGFNFVGSIKIILGLSLVSSGFFAYLWLRLMFGSLPAFFGALFYLYAPYHLWDIYKRGSVGEILALAVVPFVFWMMERGKWVLSSLGIGLLILSHNTLAVLFFPIIVIYALLRKSLTTYYLLLTTIFGFGLSAFFWLPAIFDLQYTRFFETQVASWQEHFADINLIGWVTVIIFCIVIFKLFHGLLYYDNTYYRSKLLLFFGLLGLGSVFFTTSLSSLFWRYLPVSFIQFPFRLLSLTILSGAFLTANLVASFSNKKRMFIVMVILFLILVSAKPYLGPAAFFDKGEGFYATNEDTTTVANEYMPVWAEKLPTDKPREKVEVVSGQGGITGVFANSKKINFDVNAKTNVELKINTLYFPGWVAKIDGVESSISFGNPEGLMILSIPAGKHKIEVLWKETTLRKFSNIISAFSLAALIIWQIQIFKRVKNA